MNLPSILRRNGTEPFRMLTRLQDDFDRLFQELSVAEPRLLKADLACSCEVSEDKSSYTMKFDMPGIKKEDLKIEVDGNVLTVSAERKEEKKSDSKKSHYSEISYGSYMRSFTLPSPLDEKKVDAKFENGVLTLAIPKSEASKAKQIEVH
jgi:HSP20 family protein